MQIEWERYRVCPGFIGAAHWPAGVRAAPGWAADPHTPDNNLVLIRGGRGRFRGKEREWRPLRPGVFVWLQPGRAYDIEQDPAHPLEHYFAHFELRDAAGRRRPWSAPWPPEWSAPVEREFLESAFRYAVHVCHVWQPTSHSEPRTPSETARTAAALQAILMEIDVATDPAMPAATPVPTPHAGKIRDVAMRIAAAPQETYYLADLARTSGLSVGAFCRLFRQMIGETPQQFVLGARLQRAQQLLRDTADPVGKVAEAVGYEKIYFFSRQFKQFTGQSPLAYRRTQQSPPARHAPARRG